MRKINTMKGLSKDFSHLGSSDQRKPEKGAGSFSELITKLESP